MEELQFGHAGRKDGQHFAETATVAVKPLLRKEDPIILTANRAVNKRAKLVKGSFKTYLAKRTSATSSTSSWTKAQWPQPPRNLSGFIGAGSALLARPRDLVVREEGAKLGGRLGGLPAVRGEGRYQPGARSRKTGELASPRPSGGKSSPEQDLSGADILSARIQRRPAGKETRTCLHRPHRNRSSVR